MGVIAAALIVGLVACASLPQSATIGSSVPNAPCEWRCSYQCDEPPQNPPPSPPDPPTPTDPPDAGAADGGSQ